MAFEYPLKSKSVGKYGKSYARELKDMYLRNWLLCNHLFTAFKEMQLVLNHNGYSLNHKLCIRVIILTSSTSFVRYCLISYIVQRQQQALAKFLRFSKLCQQHSLPILP